ncbi:MAG: TetR/AcrR family transcriptional regulator [Actinobacteria bacterium]|nr:TetR/AcrR family transcriptional regulator [Actinomycetota bacterium]
MITAEVAPVLCDPLPIGGTPIQARLAEAAIELFHERGAQATTVSDITRACGLTPGALYNHFTSKDDLLYVVVRDIHRQADDQLVALLASTDDEPVTQLMTAVRFLASHTAGLKKRSRVANREFTLLTGSRREEVTTIRRQIRDRLAAILLTGAQQGAFHLVGGDDMAAAILTASTIATMCVRISETTLENYPLPVAHLHDHFTELALRLAGREVSCSPLVSRLPAAVTGCGGPFP